MTAEGKSVQYLAAPEHKGERLDVWLSKFPEIESRSQATRLIEKQLVKVSGVLPLKVKGSYRLRGDEQVDVTLPAPEPSLISPEDIPLDVLYEDNDIVVINKPAGLVTHPGAGNPKGTLVNGLVHRFQYLSDAGGADRPGLVHRLDKDTSGVLVVAKNNKAHAELSLQFQNHDIHRVYWAIVAGVPKIREKTIETFLARHPKHRTAFCSQENGKKAITHYKAEKTFSNQMSLVHVRIETGRTHQIRVHLSECGYPVVGDQIYGVRRQKALITYPKLKKLVSTLPRHALHAAELGFLHPRTKKKLLFTSDWPSDLKKFLDHLDAETK